MSHPLATSRRLPWAGVALATMIAAYVALFGALTVLRHDAFQTTAFDLGNVDQAVWNTRHGRLLAMTNIEGLTNRLGTHVEPILLPISLLYFLWSDPRALLLLQTVVIALGAWPVYLLARRVLARAQPDDPPPLEGGEAFPDVSGQPAGSVQFRGHERVTGRRECLAPTVRQVLPLVFAAAYLLFPALESANVFDFHAVALAPTFFLFALYFLETERWGAFALFAVLAMACKEDAPLQVAMLGLYALLTARRHRWLVGLPTMALAAAWFLVAVGWVMPHFDTSGVSPLANRYAYLGDGPLAMAKTVLTQPGLVAQHLFTAENLATVAALLAPLAFLSLLAPALLLLAVPPLLVNLLSTEGLMQQLEGFHYGATLVPVVVVSAAYGTAWAIRRFPRFRALPLLLGAAILAASLLYHYGHGYTPLAAGFGSRWPRVTEHDRLGEALAAQIPTAASLAALPYPNPHASQRQQLTMIDRVENGLPAPLGGADTVWLDVTDSWPLHPNDLKAGVERLFENGYGIDQAVDGWLLLRRGAASTTLPDAFYSFARSPDPRPQHPMQLQFLLDGQPALECLGFDLVLQPAAADRRSTTSTLQFYWRALQPLPAGLRLYPFYFDDASGQVLEDTTLRPMIATIWYPPERWPVGEVVATRTLPWDVGRDYSVGLGAVQGDDWSQVGQRLAIRAMSSELVVRLFDGDTWARLLHVAGGEPQPERRVFAAPSPQHPLDADFGGQIRLLGYDLAEGRDRTLRLTLYWQAEQRPAGSYTVFAQVLDEAGQVRAQADAVPQDGGYPTLWWLPGEVVADPLALELPAAAPAGASYRLIVGLYDARSGARLPVAGGGDYVELPWP